LTITRRLNHIFRPDGRAVIVALDHGLIDGPCPGFERPAETIAAVVAGGADAILTSYGIARRFAAELSEVGLIVRSDGASTNLGDPSTGSTSIFFEVEAALRVGADAMVVTALPGSGKEDATLHNLATTIAEAHRWSMPVLAEMVPGGFDGPPDTRTASAIAHAARLGAELGADFIKAPYSADYGQVCESTFAPVVILGGAKGSEADMLANIRAAVEAGAAGVAMGRNVFQCEDPRAMTAAIGAVVHEGIDVAEAVAMLPGGS
jgi:DhnA family fructose-bisphosphate aldolase class Ia